MPVLLRDIFDHKHRRHDADADLFRAVVQYEFAAGLDATADGAAAAMRRWVTRRPSWISDVQQARRIAALATIETALSPEPKECASRRPGTALELVTKPDLTTTLQALSQAAIGRRPQFASQRGKNAARAAVGPVAASPVPEEDRPASDPGITIVLTVEDGSLLGPRYKVLVGGQYYEVNKYLLASLAAGVTPRQLDLEPVDEDE